jgi:hypothetical protein
MTVPTGGPVPNDEAARHPMLERLDAFIGEWSIEASFGPDVTARAVFEWVLGGQFLMERSEVPDVPEAPDGIAIIGVDRNGERTPSTTSTREASPACMR